MRITGRMLAEAMMMLLMIAVCVGIGFMAGQDVGRINALRAEKTAPLMTITKKQAAARNDPICRTVHSHRKR